MNAFKKFSCAECGGTVDMAPGVGRTREFSRGFSVPIPDDFLIPTCGRCGELYVLPEIEQKLNAVLRKRLLQMQADHYRTLVDILMCRNGIKQKDVVRACGVTPSYMSHILNGKRRASTTLTRLLEAFVVCNAEFMRHVEGRRWSPFDAGLFAVKASQSAKKSTQVPAWNVGQSGATSAHWVSRGNDSSSLDSGQAA
jgi:hypothetical protein